MLADRTKVLLKRFAKRKSDSEPDSLSIWEVLGEEYWRSEEPQKETEQCAEAEYLEAVKLYREKRALWHTARSPKQADALRDYKEAELAFRSLLIRYLHRRSRAALCFSGGGIRSAIFGLGVLQGMAAHSVAQQTNDAPCSWVSSIIFPRYRAADIWGGGFLPGPRVIRRAPPA
jgi:hypothetical protein